MILRVLPRFEFGRWWKGHADKWSSHQNATVAVSHCHICLSQGILQGDLLTENSVCSWYLVQSVSCLKATASKLGHVVSVLYCEHQQKSPDNQRRQKQSSSAKCINHLTAILIYINQDSWNGPCEQVVSRQFWVVGWPICPSLNNWPNYITTDIICCVGINRKHVSFWLGDIFPPF